MGADLPEPLVPAEVDLRDYSYMPLYGDRLFNSDTWGLCTPDEKIAALQLWWNSWHEEPSGSLPNNDRLLASRAGYGVAVKAFLGVKGNAMRGWIECNDGRLYHPVVASLALDVWKTKRKKRDDNEADRERKRLKRERLSGGQTANVRRTTTGIPADTPTNGDENPPDVQVENALKGKRSEEKGEPPPLVPPPGEKPQTKDAKHDRKSAIHADWSPDIADCQYAASRGHDAPWVGDQAERFRDHHTAKRSTSADWHAAWRNWVRRAEEFAERRPGHGNGVNLSAPARPGGIADAMRSVLSRD